MFSLDFTLNDFVTPVAICQAETDLRNILDVFAQTNASVLAIPLKNNTWGIISSQKLLAFFAKSWQKNPVAISGYPKKFSDAENESFTFATTAFNSLIEPTVVYLSSTKLGDFFAAQNKDFFSAKKDTYLIADRAGNIQGKLDLKKLLQYLGSRFNSSKVKPYLAEWQDILSDSIDSIDLPFKLETTEGKEVYLSKSWHKLVTSKPHKNIKQSSSDTSIASWWIKKQLNQAQSNIFSASHSSIDNSSDEARQQYCCLDNRHYPQDRLNLLSPITAFGCSNSKLQQLTNVVEHDSQSSVSKDLESELSEHPDNIYLQQGTEWNYLRIPISLNLQQSARVKTNQTTYWLTLAIKAAPIENQKSASLALVNDSITVNQLLATISHDLKSPLTGIVGLSGLLKERSIGTLNQRQDHYIQLIYRSAHKLTNIVNDLLELTSLTTGKANLKSEPIELKSWCDQLYEQVVTKLKSTNTPNTPEFKLANLASKLQLNISPGLTTVIGDRTHFSALVSHLILEIIKFSTSIDILSINLKIFRTNNQIVMLLSNSNELPLPQHDCSKTASNLNKPNREPNINLVIAKYLAKIIGGEVQSFYQAEHCQFTLLIPQPNDFEPAIPCADSARLADGRIRQSQSNHSGQTNRDNSPCDLTVLCLYLESEAVDSELVAREDLNSNLKYWVEQDWSDYGEQKSNYRHRIIEADGLEQADTLARIWQLDVIVLDGHQIADSDRYLRSLQQSEHLSALPLITLDTKTTEAANQIEGLNVYPCLLPAKCRSIKDLMQVIQIATGKESNR